jgi:hypothetical protein
MDNRNLKPPMNAQKTHTTVIQLSGQVSNLVITPTQGEFEFEQIDNVMFPVIAPATLAMGGPSSFRVELD